jgi:site-specific DNA recombinase
MGWGSSTIRAMLYNEKYAGVWRFKEREWVKVPGTNRRMPKARPADEVITLERPELRIVPAELWDPVRARLDATKKQYTKDDKGKQSVRNRGNYLLSGILVCDVCGTPLTIYGGSTRRYYKCGTHRSKGTCPNNMTVREDIARKAILGMIRDALMTPEGISHVRRKIAEHLRDFSKNLEKEIQEGRDRLARTTQRIKSLVSFIADGDRTEAVVSALRDLEVAAKKERAGIDRLVQESREPLHLPSIDEVTRMVFDLEARGEADPTATRAQLQRWHRSGEIRVRKRPDGVIEAWGDLLPLAILAENKDPKRSKHGDPVDQDNRATSFVAGVGFEPTTFGL